VTVKTLSSLDDLVAAGLIPPERAPSLRAVEARYSVAVTPQIAALIELGDIDPIAKQFLPDERELDVKPEELTDPIGDDIHSPLEGLVHRYRDRVLLKLLTVCPVYCRFCFRRETVGRAKGDTLSDAAVEAAMAYIAEHGEIFEVILTGGDPFALSPRRLAAVSNALGKIDHVRLLRVHTRAPVAAPEFVDSERIQALAASGKTLLSAIHVNHWRELSAAAREALARLRKAGVSLLSQTVLLAGVNDDVEVLEKLMRDLVSLGVKPYYLHHPDLATGTSHFRLSLDAGRRIYNDLAQRVSGVALPAYMLDIPGGFGKVPAQEERVLVDETADGWLLRDRAGRDHVYRNDS
jgi:lysine 2,3-aminomutase